MSARMPLARRAVTNVAEGSEAAAVDPAAEAPTTS
jgi:hypothetical protein